VVISQQMVDAMQALGESVHGLQREAWSLRDEKTEAHRSWPLTPALWPQAAPTYLRKQGEGVMAKADAPKAMLKADRDTGAIILDSQTTLAGIPAEAWDYKLGNRSALEWILDQHKEKKPKDPTIREKFDTYRFAGYKEQVIDLLMRVTRVSVETHRITEAMCTAKR
jgi:hypothetical protein